MLYSLQRGGIHIEIVSTGRTIAEQDALYAIGRDQKGDPIEGQFRPTNAKGGTSYHNYGLAFDVEVYTSGGKKDWNFSGDAWKKVIAEGENWGFTSGSRWSAPYDPPHFQNSGGYSTTELKQRYENGQMTDGFVNGPEFKGGYVD